MEFKEAYQEFEDLKIEITVLTEKQEKRQQELEQKRLAFDQLRKDLASEKKDIDQLEKLSLAQLLAKISGRLEEKQNKEYQEYMQAKRAYDEANYSVEALEQEVLRMGREIAGLKEKLKQKEESMITDFEEAKERNRQVTAERESHIRLKKEYNQAIGALERTLRIADEMRRVLEHAKSLATYDTFLNIGLVGDLTKYHEIEKAQQLQNELTEAANLMKKELQDVDISFSGVSVDIDKTTRVFDIFFDNMFTDWRVKDQITASHSKVSEYTVRLQELRGELESKKEAEEERIASCRF